MNAVKRKRCIAQLMRFRPEEIPDIVNEIFPGVSWEMIKETTVSLQLNLCKPRDIANACVNAFEDIKPPVNDVQYAMWYLQFFDAVLHKYLHWSGACLTNIQDNLPKDFQQLSQRIAQVYRMEARRVETIMKPEGDIVFIMLIERIITKRGMRSGQPFFAAFNTALDKKYIFFSPKMTENSKDHLKLLAQALGYGSYRTISFTGLDVRSMFGMIKNQIRNERTEVAVFQPSRFRKEENVLDFTQGRERMNYAVNILPPGLTNLKEFIAHAKNEFRGTLPVPPSKLLLSKLKITLSSRTQSVEDVFRELISMGKMKLPVPEYVSQFPTLDRNTIKLKRCILPQEELADMGSPDDDDSS